MGNRRLIGLVVGMLLPGLMLVRSNVPCMRHGDVDAAQPMAQGPAGQTDAHHHGETQKPQPAPDGLPTIPDCCRAMATCPVIDALGCVALVTPAVSTHDAVAALIAALPLSRIETPDPPPPKA